MVTLDGWRDHRLRLCGDGGVGVRPAVGLAGSGIMVDNGVVVDGPGAQFSGVYAAGDVTRHFHPFSLAGSEWDTGRTRSSGALLRRGACSANGWSTARSTGSGLISTR